MAQVSPRLVAWLGTAGVAAAIHFTSTGEREVDGVYPDPSNPKILTACIGETGFITRPNDIVLGAKFSHEECVAALERRFDTYAKEIQECGGSNLTLGQKIAFLDFRHNTGRFCGTTLAKRAKAGDLKGSCEAIFMWKYVAHTDCFDPANLNWAGGVCKGIKNRRSQQFKVCTNAQPL
jgi:lysozyme